jgi:hypothetical protein
MRFLCFLPLLFSLPLLAQPSTPRFLPLEPGNQWVYRDARSGHEFTVRVSTLFLQSDGKVYAAVHGYVGARRAYLRYDERGNLVRLNEETQHEEVVTTFESNNTQWWRAPFRTCDQEGQTRESRLNYSGPAGYFENVLDVRYRSFSCADAGVLREHFVAGIGMLHREESAIDGPRLYQLVYARVGRFEFGGATSGQFLVSAEKAPDGKSLDVTLRLRFDPVDVMRLEFPSAQQYDLILRDGGGAKVWQWSDGQLFGQASSVRDVAGMWVIRERVPLPEATDTSAKYEIQAWLTTTGAPRYAATTVVR